MSAVVDDICSEPTPDSAPGRAPAAPGGRWLRSDTLADGLMILLALTVVQRLVGFGRGMLFCMWLEPDQLGEWDLAYSSLLLLAQIAVLSLPPAFGRYVEHYRQRGQLRVLMKRVGLAAVSLAAVAAAAVFGERGWLSEFVFGRPDRAELIALAALGLLSVAIFSVVTELLSAMRMQRVNSGLEFLNSLLFAVLGVGLLAWWRVGAVSILLAFSVACLTSSALAGLWIWKIWRAAPQAIDPPTQSEFWAKLMPFALWVWVSQWLLSLFSIVDRYLIVHFSGLPDVEALALVGQYHSSRVIPLLLVTLAGMLGRMLTPYLSHDWEAGRRDAVSDRLNLVLKGTALTFAINGAAVLICAPILFTWIFRGRYDGGLAVLPWTLMYSTWIGMFYVAQAYLWCAEKVRLASLAVLVALAVNVGLNLLLLPRLGLLGATLSACAANLLALSGVFFFARLRGMRVDAGTWILTLLPISLGLGPWGSTAVIFAALLLAATSNLIFTASEKQQLARGANRYLSWFLSLKS